MKNYYWEDERWMKVRQLSIDGKKKKSEELVDKIRKDWKLKPIK